MRVRETEQDRETRHEGWMMERWGKKEEEDMQWWGVKRGGEWEEGKGEGWGEKDEEMRGGERVERWGVGREGWRDEREEWGRRMYKCLLGKNRGRMKK